MAVFVPVFVRLTAYANPVKKWFPDYTDILAFKFYNEKRGNNVATINTDSASGVLQKANGDTYAILFNAVTLIEYPLIQNEIFDSVTKVFKIGKNTPTQKMFQNWGIAMVYWGNEFI